MTPEDIKKLSDSELDEEIDKIRTANKKAIKNQNKKEEQNTLTQLNMLEDERLERERKRRTKQKEQNMQQPISGKNTREDQKKENKP